jgi:hypothetical protein
MMVVGANLGARRRLEQTAPSTAFAVRKNALAPATLRFAAWPEVDAHDGIAYLADSGRLRVTGDAE